MSAAIGAEPVPLRVDSDGTIRVGTTRITLDVLLGRHLRGDSPEEIVRAFNVLNLADVYGAIAYYLRHRDEVDEYLRRREEEATKLQQIIEANQPPGPTKEELLRRLAERSKDHAPPCQ